MVYTVVDAVDKNTQALLNNYNTSLFYFKIVFFYHRIGVDQSRNSVPWFYLDLSVSLPLSPPTNKTKDSSVYNHEEAIDTFEEER